MGFFSTFKTRGFGCGPRFGSKRCGRALSSQQMAERREKMVNRAADKLQLNAEQKPLLGTLLEQVAAQRQAMVGQTTDMRAELRSWFAGSHFDVARAQALINDKASTLQSQSPQVLSAMGAFFDRLNPAQQQKVRNWMEGPRGWIRRA